MEGCISKHWTNLFDILKPHIKARCAIAGHCAASYEVQYSIVFNTIH